jgi:hypothetical protein
MIVCVIVIQDIGVKSYHLFARTGLKYERGTSEYFKGCECNKGTFYTYVLQHFIYDCEIIAPVLT